MHVHDRMQTQRSFARRGHDHRMPPDQHQYDLLTCGLLFTDMTFTGLPSGGPQLGHEYRVAPYVQTPGGIANSSIAAARLGLDTCMVADVGDDPMTIGALARLHDEGIDTRHALVHEGWQTPLTVLLNYDGDRALVTSETAHPGDCMLKATRHPRARAAITHLQPYPMAWLAQARADGTLVVGDTGFDETGRWNLDDLPDLGLCDVFTPNLVEALHYTRTDTPEDAVRALADRVRIPVVTLGGDGVLSWDAATGELLHVPPVPTSVVDTGGAGDVFSAGLVAGLLGGLPLELALRLGSLVSAITISAPGGATSAPALEHLAAWVDRIEDPALRRDLRFVHELGPEWMPAPEYAI